MNGAIEKTLSTGESRVILLQPLKFSVQLAGFQCRVNCRIRTRTFPARIEFHARVNVLHASSARQPVQARCKWTKIEFAVLTPFKACMIVDTENSTFDANQRAATKAMGFLLLDICRVRTATYMDWKHSADCTGIREPARGSDRRMA